MVLDVRTPEESLFVGHPTMAWRDPIAAQVYEGDAARGHFPMKLFTDGMEGDAVEDPTSVFLGQRLENGWKNSGCPWTHALTPARLVLSEVP